MDRIIGIVIGCLFLIGCTEQIRAKRFGGKTNVDLKCDQKLEVITWKDANAWFLTRPMRADDEPVIHTFAESSSWGMLEGSITIKESRCK